MKKMKYTSDYLGPKLTFYCQKDVNSYIANGGDMCDCELTHKQIKKIPRKILNPYIANGKNIRFLSKIQKLFTPQKYINQFIKNGGYLGNLLKIQLLFAPRKIIYKRIANGEDFRGLLKWQIRKLPPNLINEYVSNGGNEFFLFSKKQKALISQKAYNAYAANGGNLIFIESEYEKLIPKEIKIKNDSAEHAVVLYSLGKITFEELPIEAFVNYETRKDLLRSIEQNAEATFLKILYQNDDEDDEDDDFYDDVDFYDDEDEIVPEELINALTERCNKLEKQVNMKKEEYLQMLSENRKHKVEKTKEIEMENHKVEKQVNMKKEEYLQMLSENRNYEVEKTKEIEMENL